MSFVETVGEQLSPQTTSPFDCDVLLAGENSAWVGLYGELDRHAGDSVADHLEKALADARLVTVDIRQLTAIDASGMDVIVAAHVHAPRVKRRLLLIRRPAGRPTPGTNRSRVAT